MTNLFQYLRYLLWALTIVHITTQLLKYTFNINVCLGRLSVFLSFVRCFRKTVHQSNGVLVTLKSFLQFISDNVLCNFDDFIFIQRSLALDLLVGFDEQLCLCFVLTVAEINCADKFRQLVVFPVVKVSNES